MHDFFPPTDSENPAVTLSALLASLNSCCNPWIYMIFSGHLLSDFFGLLPCCHRLRDRFRHQDSDSSIRRTTLLSRLQGPRLSEPFRDFNFTIKNCPQATPAPWPSQSKPICINEIQGTWFVAVKEASTTSCLWFSTKGGVLTSWHVNHCAKLCGLNTRCHDGILLSLNKKKLSNERCQKMATEKENYQSWLVLTAYLKK